MRPSSLVVAVVAAISGLVLLVVMVASVFSGGGDDPGSSSACGSTPATMLSAAGLTAEQLANAAAVVSTGTSLGVPTQGEVIALATAMQESNLTVLNHGDAAGPDSRGLFQQRDSWGPTAVRMDPAGSANLFYAALLAVPGWQAMPVTVAAQRVQRSAFPDAYARWEPVARQLLSGVNVTDAACAPLAVPPGSTGAGHGTPAVETAIAFALSKVGLPYQWGGTGPLYDCSGLTQAAYAAAGVALPRDTYGQVTVGQPVALTDLQRGDLWLPDAGHVGIYLGGNMVVEAPHAGAFVQVVPVWGSWQARRVA